MLLTVHLLLLLIISASGQQERDQACTMLIVVDQTAWPGLPMEAVKTRVLTYVKKLNKIYLETILKNPPHQQIYFRVTEIRRVEDFMVGCENKGVILAEFTKIAQSRDFCLAHLITNRDFGCVIGLANIGGLCKNYGNVGWSKVDADTDTMVNTLAHEIGHNFGADHDGADSIQYRSCTGDNVGIMAGGSIKRNFSTCSLSAMHAKLQKVLEDEMEGEKCFENIPKSTDPMVQLTNENLSSHKAACPKLPPDECQDDQPDPPEVPEPPEEPVCGDLVVEDPAEECDCGFDYLQCQDPCCYPAVISDYDRDLNASAKPCTRNQKEVCISPFQAPIKYGLVFPFAFILLLVLLLAVLLWLDWRYGKRMLYFHITEREERRNEPLHVETEEQKERRLQRERESARLKA